jgi:hypothetical protein
MRRRPHPCWLVLLLACDPGAGTEVGNPTNGCSEMASADGSDDPRNPYCQQAPPSFRCDGVPCDLLDFGELPVGQEGRVVLELRNEGCEAATLRAPVPEGGPAFLEGPRYFPTYLPPGESVAFTVGFTPTAPGPTGGDLVFPLEPGGEWYLPWAATGR